MFSGQGSQYYEMGRELYLHHSRFKLWMDHCNSIVSPLIGASLVDIIYNEQVNKSEPFDQIVYTNPALLCIEYSLARILMEMSVQPDYLLGYSLGEITASVVSGAVSLEEGIQWVVDYAKLLQKDSRPAGMLAIIESVDIMSRYPDLFQNCWLTGKNFQSNFVVGGLSDDIQDLQAALNQKNMISQRLPVNYGFHTPLMDSLEDEVKQLFQRLNLSPIEIPVISSQIAEEIFEFGDNYLWDVVRRPVEFEKTINSMLQNGDYIFIDVGPSGSLSTFVKYLLPPGSNSQHFEVINQFGKDLNSIEKLETALNRL